MSGFTGGAGWILAGAWVPIKMFRLFPFCMLLLFSKVLRGSLLENGASVRGGDGITVAGGVLRTVEMWH